MKKLLAIFLVFYSIQIYAQSVEEIKNSADYVWGEGCDITLDRADKSAVQMLTSGISVHVEGSFSREADWGEGKEFNEKIQMVIKTYSSATLTNTKRIVLSNEPEACVFRYIHVSEVKKIFEKRKNKVLAFVQSAEKAEREGRIADAVRNYNWAWFLLKSHPDAAEIYQYDSPETNRLLLTDIPAQVNSIFSKIDVKVTALEEEENLTTAYININYKDKPVENFDFSYWDGTNWSNLYSVRDGQGLLEYLGASKKVKEVKIKAEYIYASEARIDRELEDVMGQIRPMPYRSAYFTVSAKNVAENKTPEIAPENTDLKNVTKLNKGNEYENTVKQIVDAVASGNWQAVKSDFTDEGYDVFLRLLKNGRVRLMGTPDLQAAEFNGQVMVRSVPMRFDFQSNNRKFVEDIVFHFNKDKKISSITFGLSNVALNDIMRKKVWDEKVRLTLVNFLEHYKTAYALKQLDYIESIFADDALIIVGNYSLQKKAIDGRYTHNKVLKYNRYSKQEYIKKLRYSFNSKEYINLRFEESKLRKSGAGGEVYGIQIKQHYFSSNYGDTGYLFLMVDLNEPAKPIIHVRTWQPEPNADGSIYGLSDF